MGGADRWLNAGLDGAVLGVVALSVATVGGLTGWARARALQPMESQERRDAVLGWGIVGVLVGAIAIAALIGVGD